MRIFLVSMPWSRRDRPSAGISALAGFVRRERPTWKVSCRSEFLATSQRIGRELYDPIAEDAYRMGELMYMPILYPEKIADVRTQFESWARSKGLVRDLGSTFDTTFERLASGVEALAEQIAGDADVVGLTTCFGQLFANLAVSAAIKKRAPTVQIVLGGSTVTGRVGNSLLREYPFVDHVIQGEGELPLVALVDALAQGRAGPGPELGTLSGPPANGAPAAKMVEVGGLDELPFPDYDEYAAAAEAQAVEWLLPLEASRGCWWDRTRRHGNPRATCYFCNLNIQWNGYREKSVARVVDEVVALGERHRNLKLYFVDNIIRHTGVTELADALQATGKEFEIFYEMRANLTGFEFLRMWEAGLRSTQFGIEGLSTAFLRRIGKGTTVIQNLHAMRLCTEFGVENLGNLIVDFPGATEAEVAESRDNLLRYALGFQPLEISGFNLSLESTVEVQPDAFGIANIRNRDSYRIGLPDQVWRRLSLCELDFDLVRPGVDWRPLLDACDDWRRLHRERERPLLVYRDGGSFLTIEDHRFEEFRSGTLQQLEREVYLYCMEPRSFGQLERRFGGETELREVLEACCEYRIMYGEGDRYLSLAVASSPHLAAARIRGQRAAEQPSPERPRSLPLHR